MQTINVELSIFPKMIYIFASYKKISAKSSFHPTSGAGVGEVGLFDGKCYMA